MKRTPFKPSKIALKRSGFKNKGKVKKTPKPTPKRTTAPKKSIRKLRKELWKLFSLYIRTRDKFTCFTCGKCATGSAMHAGHFITGATCPPELYFDETNVNAQCYHCNINLSGNWVIYEQKMIQKHGQSVVDDLKLKRTLLMGQKKDEVWYLGKIEEYKLLCLVLLN